MWAQGARGEAAVGATLDGLAEVHSLHDRARRLPNGRPSRANIDHLAITPTGVWVVDAKTHAGELEVHRSGGWFGPRVEKLVINGRDATRLLEKLRGQVAAVQGSLEDAYPAVPVRGALCFVGTELPWFGDRVDGIPLVGRRGLARLLRAPGPCTPQRRADLLAVLARAFPPAH